MEDHEEEHSREETEFAMTVPDFPFPEMRFAFPAEPIIFFKAKFANTPHTEIYSGYI